MLKLASPEDTIRKRDLFHKRWTWVLLAMLRHRVRGYEDFDFESHELQGWTARDIHRELPDCMSLRRNEKDLPISWRSTFNTLKRCEEANTVASKLCKSLARNGKRFWWLTDWGVERAKWLRPRMHARWRDEYPPFYEPPYVLKKSKKA